MMVEEKTIRENKRGIRETQAIINLPHKMKVYYSNIHNLPNL
jgi:hypothetical protein